MLSQVYWKRWKKNHSTVKSLLSRILLISTLVTRIAGRMQRGKREKAHTRQLPLSPTALCCWCSTRGCRHPPPLPPHTHILCVWLPPPPVSHPARNPVPPGNRHFYITATPHFPHCARYHFVYLM